MRAKRALRGTVRFVVSFAVIFCALTVLLQDFKMFPELAYSLFSKRSEGELYGDVEKLRVQTEDGKELAVWRFGASADGILRGFTGILFRGNGGQLVAFRPLQEWLSSLGANVYMFNYRGYGTSTGWPSERGIYRDSDAVYQYALEREKTDNRKTIFFAYSMGTGPAAYMANRYNPAIAILLSAYSDIPRLAADQEVLGWLFRPLSIFLWWHFPSANYLSHLHDTCLVLGHGERDRIVPVANAFRIREQYRGRIPLKLLVDSDAHHNNVFYVLKDRLTKAVEECVKIDLKDETNSKN